MNETRRFSYQRNKDGFLGTVAMFFFLLLGEGSVLFLLIGIFAKNETVRLLLFLLVGVLLLFVLGWMLSPLGTRHALSPTHLQLRYGLGLQADIARAQLLSAKTVRERHDPMQAITVQHNEKTKRLCIALSGQGQVLLRLKEPHGFRFWPSGGGIATSILLNVDDPIPFLEALGLPEEVTSPPPATERPRPVVRESRAPRPVVAFPTEDAAPLALHTEGLSRHFGSFAAVRGLNLAIRRGEIYGFLGANGAGKSTTIKMLVGLLQPSEGRAFLAGHDVWAASLVAKAALGYVPDSAILYERLSAREFLAFLAHLRGLPLEESRARAESLLDIVELSSRADEPCGSFSYGMKRKLSLAGALLHQPAVLILDEPLNGLDPRSARRIKELFAELAAGGTTIFLSTHDLATAESVCDRVGILHQGQLLAEGPAHEMRQLTNTPDLEAAFLALTEAQGVAA